MALRQAYTAAGEIPVALREHYTETDGRWLLQTDPPTEDVTGLKTALDSERRLRRDADSQLTALKTKFEGIDPDDVTRMREQVAAMKDKELYDKDGLDALVGRRTGQMKEDHARQLAAKERELMTLRATNADLDMKWRRNRLETELTTAFVKAGVAKHAMPDAIERGLKVFRDLDDDGRPVAKKGQETLYGKNGVDPLSPDEWALSLRTEAPHLWPPSSGSGAMQGHMNGAGGIDYSKLPPAERLTRYRQEHAAKR